MDANSTYYKKILLHEFVFDGTQAYTEVARSFVAHASEYTLSSSIQSTKVTRYTVLRLPVMFRVLPRKSLRWHGLGGV